MSSRIDEDILKTVADTEGLNTGELIGNVATRLNRKRHDVAKNLYQLSIQGEIKLQDPNPPKNVLGFTLSVYSLWFWALLILVGIAMVSIYLLPQITPYIYVRYITGSLFALYLPGYSLIEALYPNKENLTPLERLALSIGLSLVLVPLVGLMLNYTPWGIRLNPIFASLSVLTVMLAGLAVARKFVYFKMTVNAETRRVEIRGDVKTPHLRER